jgi:hypothetical protein
LDKVEIDQLSVHVAWSSQSGAKASHVASAAELMEDERATHYWDPDQNIGAAFQHHIANVGSPAWDVWMLFAPGLVWGEEAPPPPTWWEHQLSAVEGYANLRRDTARFAQKAVELNNARH